MYKQFLLPIDQFKLKHKKFDLVSNPYSNDFDNLVPFESGKSIIHFLAKKFNLKRSDEVFISTTTNSSFVSSCVTSTLFNYCKLSRVLTSKTKLIYIIHEFGFPNKNIHELIDFSNEMNIPLVEDVAHSFNSKTGNELLGRIASYGFCSFPKFLPMNKGAFLFTKDNDVSIELNKETKLILHEFSSWSNYLISLKEKSQTNYKNYQSEIDAFESIFEYDDNIHPFVFGFKHKKYEFINKHLEQKGVQVARTYVKNFIMLPTNPFIDENEIDKNINILKKLL